MSKYKLYKHTSPSGKIYIGITSMESTNHRWKNGEGYRNNEHFYNAIKKYGWDNIEHEILYSNLTKDEACLLEQCYIALYESNNPNFGYNNTLGGEGALGHTMSEEGKKIISESIKHCWKKGKLNTNESKSKRKLSIMQFYQENNINRDANDIEGYMFYKTHMKLTQTILNSAKQTKTIRKFLLITDKGYSGVFYTVQNAAWFLYNTKYLKRKSDLYKINSIISSRVLGKVDAKKALPLKYTENTPVYVIPLTDGEYEHFVTIGEFNWFVNLRAKIESGYYN